MLDATEENDFENTIEVFLKGTVVHKSNYFLKPYNNNTMTALQHNKYYN